MKSFITWISKYNKAIVGGITSGVVAYLSLRSGGVTNEEWIQIIGAILGGAGFVWAVPNNTSKNKGQ